MGRWPTEGDENGSQSGGRITSAGNARGRSRSGAGESVKEFDPGRV
jgi:hypothetical protein